jgi:dihydroorotate dehydrogenase
MKRDLALFGSRKQTVLLILIACLEESFPSEMSRISGIPIATTIQAVDKFELMGLLAVSTRGKERRVRLNPRFFALKELKALIGKVIEGEPEIQSMLERVRTRPRRKAKEI